MKKKEKKINKLTEEFINLLKKGNITLEEITKDPTFLVTHPDFDKAIDILTELEELFNVQ